ncbi:hypothetical protein GGH99_006350, partial [Coemansia sp. RSA 1285]
PKARTAGPKLAKIIEDFEAASPEELNLMQGDVVTIISQGTENEDRWKGEYHGKKGYFPAHVVELIEESAELEDNGEESSGEAASKPKGFKLAAYGVQQGGIGSIFAAGGMPMLRKSGPRKNSDADQQQQQSSAAAMAAPVPAQPPVIPKLRSVQRSASKEETKEEEEEPQQQTNFLAQLNRVPRKSVKSASSEESLQVSPQPMAAVPPVPISRKATASSSAEPETADSREASAGAAPPAGVPEMESRETDSIAEVPETDAAADAVVPPVSSKKNKKAAEDVSNEQAEAIDAENQAAGVGQDGEDAQASAEDSEQQVNDISSNSSPALDPVKSPALSNVKRLVRRGPRQMPTSEGLKKKSSEESQAQSLRSALQNEKTAEPEPEPQPEPEVAKSARPALPEKPRGIGSRFSQFGGPQLPSGGFKASGRVGSAMASRLAALQARASGNNDDDDDGDNTGAAAAPNGSAADANAGNGSVGGGSSRGFAASRTSSVDAASSPPSGGRKPSAATAAAAAVSSEWQRQVEEEQTRLRSDINKAREGSEAAARLESRLVASERENQAHKQTISRLEEHIQTLTAQLSALKSDVAGIQRSVAGLDSSKGVTAVEVASIVRGELGSALQPLEKQTLALSKENKALDKKVGELRAYVDELVVEDDQQQ